MGSIYQNSEIDITNQRFGRLTAIKRVGVASWMFKCDCGNIITMPYSQTKVQKSCGCLWNENKERFAKNARKHGGTGTALYHKYCAIKQRCYNPNNGAYHRYGGRGIEMCAEWKNSFSVFREWAYKNGYNPNVSHFECSLDRIDNDKGYSPDNCRFVNHQEQMINQEKTIVVLYNGKKYSSWGFAKEYGITSPSFAYKRFKKGVPPEKVLEEWEKTKQIPKHLITLEEAAKKYGKTEGHIRRMLNQGKLKGERINWKWYVKKEQ